MSGCFTNISAQNLMMLGSLVNNCVIVGIGKTALNWTINNLHKRFQIQWKKSQIETIATDDIYYELPPCQLLQWDIQNGVIYIAWETVCMAVITLRLSVDPKIWSYQYLPHGIIIRIQKVHKILVTMCTPSSFLLAKSKQNKNNKVLFHTLVNELSVIQA